MRAKLLVVLGMGGVLAGLLAGCASGETRATAPVTPTSEELPILPEVQRTIPARVIVEGGRRDAGRRLVPDFAPPALTPEEQRILGRDVTEFQFLKYADLRLRPGGPVGPWYAGADVGTFSGMGGPLTALDRAVGVSGVLPGLAGAEVAVARPRRVTGVLPPDQPETGVGPFEAGPQIGIDPDADGVADHFPAQQYD